MSAATHFQTVSIAAAALAMLATSCTKETDEVKQMPITINASYEGGNSKVAYTESSDNITATWESGDKILVAYDGYVSELTLSSGAGTDAATFSGTIRYRTEPTASSVLSCYVKDQNDTAAVTIDEENGNAIIYSDSAFLTQDGTLSGAAKCNTYFGMATYGDGSNIQCVFSLNVAICKFNLKDIFFDAYLSATLEYKSGDNTLAKATFSVVNGDNLIYLAVPAGGYSGVQKIVYTCGTTTMTSTLSSTQANFVAGHTYSKSITFTPEGSIANGRFTVNDSGKKVWFSKGNLQAVCTSADGDTNTQESFTWRFAEHQWDYIGGSKYSDDSLTQTGNNLIDGNGSVSAPGTVDLFSWVGESSILTGAAAYGLTNVGENGRVWGNGNNANEGLKSDWGNLFGAGWYTLSIDEWGYLFNTRSTASGIRFAKAMVNEICGVILLPDNWSISYYSLNSTNDSSANFTANNISSANWNSSLEAYGAGFLPAAGFRIHSGVSYPNALGFYWSSSSVPDEVINTYSLRVYESDINVHLSYRFFGLSVRLVHPVE